MSFEIITGEIVWTSKSFPRWITRYNDESWLGSSDDIEGIIHPEPPGAFHWDTSLCGFLYCLVNLLLGHNDQPRENQPQNFINNSTWESNPRYPECKASVTDGEC